MHRSAEMPRYRFDGVGRLCWYFGRLAVTGLLL